MKLDRDQNRILSAALKTGAITRAQRAELLRIAQSFGDLSPRTIGLAIAVLRSGGLAEASARAASDEDRDQLRAASDAFATYCEPVQVRAVPQCTRDGRRTDSACAPKAARFDLGGVPAWLGARTEIVVEDAGGLLRLPARWALVPLGSLLTSHDPLRDFAPRPGYPPSLQERDYQGGETEQQKVRNAAGNLYPELLLSDNRDALTGAPIIDRARRVLGGNGRAMALILHAAQSSENRYARALARELACNTCFGLWGAPLEADAVLVRVLDEVRDTLAISRQLNAPLSAAQTREVEAFSLGQRLSDGTLGRIADELEKSESIGDAIDRLAGQLVSDLARDGIITPTQRPAWLQTHGGEVAAKLNRAGRERVIDAVIALSVRDLALMRDASPAILQLCAQLAPFIIRFDRWDAANRSGYNWAPAFRRALPFLVSTQELVRDVAELRAYWGTRQLFEAEPGLGLSPDVLKADAEGLCCYWWLVSLIGRPRVSSDRARRTWTTVPPELRGAKSLYGLRDRLELVEAREDPWSLRESVGWPSEAAFLDLGSNAAVGELTELRANLRDWDAAIDRFNETTAERAGVRAQVARLVERWTPQVVPVRVFTARAEEDRERLAAELRAEVPRDFALSPFEPPPPRQRAQKPVRERAPWQDFRDAGLTLAIAKRLVGLGFQSAEQLRAALAEGVEVPGFGRARLAKLRAVLGLPEPPPRQRVRRERLQGGRADNLPDAVFDPEALRRGTEHELAEHTTDVQTAREIAKDHLTEDPLYYPRLEAMEAAARVESVETNELNELRNQLQAAKQRTEELYETWNRLKENPKATMQRIADARAKWERKLNEQTRLRNAISRVEESANAPAGAEIRLESAPIVGSVEPSSRLKTLAEMKREAELAREQASAPKRTIEERRRADVARARGRWFAKAQELLNRLQMGSKTSATEREIETLRKQLRFETDVLSNLESAEVNLALSRADQDAVRERLMREPQGVAERQSMNAAIDLATISRREKRSAAKSAKVVSRTCPTCKTPGALSAFEAARGYQCQACTRREEGVGY